MGKFKHANIDRLLREERRAEIDPEGLLMRSGLSAGDVVADIGCGPGFFAIPAAGIVGRGGGIVYALDTQPEMIRSLWETDPPANVIPMVSGEHSFPLDDSSVDFVLLAYVLHEADDTGAFLAEVSRISRQGARLLLVDWERQVEERGPPVEERISPDEAARHLEAAGFTGCEAGKVTESHYWLTATRSVK